MSEKRAKKYFKKLTHKYRLVLLNENSFEEVSNVRTSRLGLLSLTLFLLILLVSIIYSLLAYTGLRELIPGYPDAEMRRNIRENVLKLDSLEYEQAVRDQYFHNLNLIIAGESPELYMNDTVGNSLAQDINFIRSSNDSVLRQQVEAEEQFRLSVLNEPERNRSLTELHFFAPVTGIITREFSPADGHFGVDLVADPNEVVKAALDGTVTMSNWTLETGHVIQIQHDNELITVYKHNATLFKEVGEKVMAGDAIAIVGNSGELTTGPHLHFELWHDRVPLNPVDYIVF